MKYTISYMLRAERKRKLRHINRIRRMKRELRLIQMRCDDFWPKIPCIEMIVERALKI